MRVSACLRWWSGARSCQHAPPPSAIRARTCSRRARVATRVAPEAIVEYVSVRVFADTRAHELPCSRGRFQVLQSANDVIGEVVEVGLASIEEIRSRLAEQVLHAVRDEPGRNDGQGEAQQTGMQLPQLALPDHRLWRPNGHGRAGHKDEANDGDEDNGAPDGNQCRKPDGDRLVDGVREAGELLVLQLDCGSQVRLGVETYAMLRSSSEKGRLVGSMSPRT